MYLLMKISVTRQLNVISHFKQGHLKVDRFALLRFSVYIEYIKIYIVVCVISMFIYVRVMSKEIMLYM